MVALSACAFVPQRRAGAKPQGCAAPFCCSSRRRCPCLLTSSPAFSGSRRERRSASRGGRPLRRAAHTGAGYRQIGGSQRCPSGTAHAACSGHTPSSLCARLSLSCPLQPARRHTFQPLTSTRSASNGAHLLLLLGLLQLLLRLVVVCHGARTERAGGLPRQRASYFGLRRAGDRRRFPIRLSNTRIQRGVLRICVSLSEGTACT